MKNGFLKIIAAIAFLVCSDVLAQDTILLLDKSKIPCKISQIRATRIEYFPENNPRQVLYSIDRNRVHIVKYNTGSTDTITNSNPKPAQQQVGTADTFKTGTDAYYQGVEDGRREYDATTETVCSGGSAFIPFGIITPIIYSATDVKPAKIKNTKFLESKNNSYKEGFVVGASKKRTARAWTSFCATGSSVLLVYVLVWTAVL